ncbi:MAG: metallophosphoesterase family protein [Actinomycetota bacterium]
MKIAVIADTHTRGMTRSVPLGVWPYLESADHILHAGDVVDPSLLEEMKAVAPVTVVLGNCDAWDIRDWGATQTAELTLGGIAIGMVHDSGLTGGRRDRMRKLFPNARVVVFGHSHMPFNEDADGLLLFNPGSPTWKRRAPFPSMGLLWIDGDEVEGEIFPV